MEGTKFIERYIFNRLNDLNCCIPATVESIDKQTSKINAKPLLKAYVDGQLTELPVLIDIPLFQFMTSNFIIRTPVNAGDYVLLIFADYDMQNLVLTGELRDPNTDDIHALNDAIAIPLGLNPFNNNLPAENENDLVIAQKDYTSKIVIKQNGDITVETDGSIFLGSDSATQGVPLGTSLKTWLDGHVHSSSGAGSPTTNSPDPSTKVKVE